MRNTEEAERASKGGAAAEGGRRAIASGMGTGTKESELAKSIQGKKVRACFKYIYIYTDDLFFGFIV